MQMINITKVRDIVLDKYLPLYLNTYFSIDYLNMTVEEAMENHKELEDALCSMVLETLCEENYPVFPLLAGMVHGSVIQEINYYLRG